MWMLPPLLYGSIFFIMQVNMHLINFWYVFNKKKWSVATQIQKIIFYVCLSKPRKSVLRPYPDSYSNTTWPKNVKLPIKIDKMAWFHLKQPQNDSKPRKIIFEESLWVDSTTWWSLIDSKITLEEVQTAIFYFI